MWKQKCANCLESPERECDNLDEDFHVSETVLDAHHSSPSYVNCN